MESDKSSDMEKELTSTSSSVMDNLQLKSDDEKAGDKSDSNDTLPTSSTDANTSSKCTNLVSEDSISSTSCDMDPSKLNTSITETSDKSSSTFDTDAELLGMSMMAGSHEKIEENVDDLVNDLETLLGESTDSFNVPVKSPVTNEPKTEAIENVIPTENIESEVSSNTVNVTEKSVVLVIKDTDSEVKEDSVHSVNAEVTGESETIVENSRADFSKSEDAILPTEPQAGSSSPQNKLEISALEDNSQKEKESQEAPQDSAEPVVEQPVESIEVKTVPAELTSNIQLDVNTLQGNEDEASDKDDHTTVELAKEISADEAAEEEIEEATAKTNVLSPEELSEDFQKQNDLDKHIEEEAFQFEIPNSIDSCVKPEIREVITSLEEEQSEALESANEPITDLSFKDDTLLKTAAQEEIQIETGGSKSGIESNVTADIQETFEESHTSMEDIIPEESLSVIEEPKEEPQSENTAVSEMEITEIPQQVTILELKNPELVEETPTSEVEITELPETALVGREEIEVTPVVVEPEVEKQKELVEQAPEDGIKEITESEITKEHLEEIKVVPVIETVELVNEDAEIPTLISENLVMVDEDVAVKGTEVNVSQTNNIEDKITESLPNESPSDIVQSEPVQSTEALPKEIDDAIENQAAEGLEISSEPRKDSPLEMIVRRKTVEQDLEKVVCLSEESSDSDSSEAVTVSIVPSQSEEHRDIINIPEEISELPDSAQAEDQNIPAVIMDEILPIPPSEPPSNLETMLAVASLQNETAPVSEGRRLSEKEIRDMEALRMAVASITDSSQSNYDDGFMEVSMEETSSAVVEDVTETSENVQVPDNLPSEVESVPVLENEVAAQEMTLEESDEKSHIESTANVSDAFDSENVGVPSEEIKEIVPEDGGMAVPEVAPILELSAFEPLNKDQESDKGSIEILDKIPEIVQVQGLVQSAEEVENKTFEETLNKSEQEIVKPVAEQINMDTKVVSDVRETVETYEFKATNEVISVEDQTCEKEKMKPELQKSDDVIVAVENVGNPEPIQPERNCVSPVEEIQVAEEKPLRGRTRRGNNKVSEPLTINVEETERRERIYSPKLPIKALKNPDEDIGSNTGSEAELNKGSLKMTITKQADKMHSILKVYNPDEESEQLDIPEEPIRKLIIKPKMQQIEQQHSPKIGTRSSKTYSPTSPRCSSPRVTIKPVTKPVETKAETLGSLKITFKPVVKPEESVKKHSPKLSRDAEKNHNPKIIIKPIPKPIEMEREESVTPKVTIKPIKRHPEEAEESEQEKSSPKITIKPVVKPPENDAEPTAPKLKIKPLKKHEEDLAMQLEREQNSTKIHIKPVVKPTDPEQENLEEVKERIVLKINKGSLPSPIKESKKREYPEEEKVEKVAIKLKFSTTGGQTHIVQEGEESNKRQRKDSGHFSGAVKKDMEEASLKRPLEDKIPEKNKRLRNAASPDKINADLNKPDSVEINVKSHQEPPQAISKIVDLASETTHIVSSPVLTVGVATPVSTIPKRRGRPPKGKTPNKLTPLPPSPQTTPSRVELTPTVPEATPATSASGRPKRSCRGLNVMATLGIKPRKPRARGRGSRVNMGDRGPPPMHVPPPEELADIHVEEIVRPEKEDKGKTKQPLKTDEDVVQQLSPHVEKLPEDASAPQQKLAEEEAIKLAPQIAAKDESSAELTKRTPPRKLEVTTRRQKAQLQKEVERIVEKSPEKFAEEVKKPAQIKSNPKRASQASDNEPASPASSTASSVTIVEVTGPSPKKTSPGKKVLEKADESGVEAKKSKVEKTDSLQTQPKETDSASKLSSSKTVDPEIIIIDDDDKESDEEEEEEEEEEESDGDSESEKRREYVLQRKQEAIKKCRAKRMEKLARAAEVKKRRQEQAAQQREARKAAEEAEKAASEKSRATRRYGRYGVPKPQISLIDAPVQELEGTVKGLTGLFSPGKVEVNISQPIVVEDDNSEKDKSEVSVDKILGFADIRCELQQLTPVKSSGQSSESMVVDPLEETAVKSVGSEDVVMLDEDTRMSADFRSSRSHTPAKQTIPAPDILVEDSQGSIGTEGGKSRTKTPKMEVFQDLESLFTADQLAEYSWNGQGPFMLQEQVTHFLGIKSFKRKYPNVTRRTVDMQERDFLKENNQVTERQCDLGLTAVLAQDILDIMYTDFQDKYEEYCRAQRERQAREMASKQRALNQVSQKPGFDKMDLMEQAVQSVSSWNQQFNKTRKEQRRAYMDLQTFTIHYPRMKRKILATPKTGHYPVTLVPGQFIDHYREFTPTELNNLPLNTMCYDEIKIPSFYAEFNESSSGSDSDSDSGSSESSTGTECDDSNCKECTSKGLKNGVRDTDSDVMIIENDASSSDSVVLVSVSEGPVKA
ncbi:putative leucine-rich repeat-containing protein DDB_G0290503 isoform X2 [Euwallacea similis]|uniref:putative leucine-rich repeat-containing protein DDB_G0290503 isoform X2 n=1 Tax=Euwallacea similis TaxID=1736056 RepID=UPI003450893B